jgi:hypothetical protein
MAGPAVSVSIDLEALQDFHACLERAPTVLFKELAKAFTEIGRYDINRIRSNVSGNLKLTSQGAAKSFKFKATDVGKANSFDKLFTDEYTGWKAAKIFQTGGTITGKNKNLTIIFPEGRSASGKRKFTQSDLRNMILEKKVRLVPTPRGMLIIQSMGGLTKTGQIKTGGKGPGSRDVIIGILKRSVDEKKRIDFYETFDAAGSVHTEMLEYAIENTLATIAASDKGE